MTGGSGTALLGPDGTYSVSDVPPSDVTVGDSGALAPEPVYEPVPVTEPAPEAVAAPVETTEPVVADTDGDAVADVDEANLYGTDSLVRDTDGDGLADGEELIATGTDPWSGTPMAMGSRTERRWRPAPIRSPPPASPGACRTPPPVRREPPLRRRWRELFGLLTDPLVWDTDGDGVRDGETVVVDAGIDDAGWPILRRDRSSPDHRDEIRNSGMAARSAAMPPATDRDPGNGGQGGRRGIDDRCADREDEPHGCLLAFGRGSSQIINDREGEHRHDDDQKWAEHPPPCAQLETDEEGESKRDQKSDRRGDLLGAPLASLSRGSSRA